MLSNYPGLRILIRSDPSSFDGSGSLDIMDLIPGSELVFEKILCSVERNSYLGLDWSNFFSKPLFCRIVPFKSVRSLQHLPSVSICIVLFVTTYSQWPGQHCVHVRYSHRLGWCRNIRCPREVNITPTSCQHRQWLEGHAANFMNIFAK